MLRVLRQSYLYRMIKLSQNAIDKYYANLQKEVNLIRLLDYNLKQLDVDGVDVNTLEYIRKIQKKRKKIEKVIEIEKSSFEELDRAYRATTKEISDEIVLDLNRVRKIFEL